MIDFKEELNAAQYEAVSSLAGPVLVIAGAGSGKTRTIVYRLANMVQSGIPASSILLLTFTRKAANEMLERARRVLFQDSDLHDGGYALASVQGGTFHSFAYSVLRLFKPEGYERPATVMDSSDSLSILQQCREDLKAGKGDRSFPRNQAIQGLLSKSRNREQDLEEILRRDSAHLLPHAETMRHMGESYARIKRERSLLDYDDLLFEFEKLLGGNTEALNYCRRRHQYIMVDEFQDTNLVQARITALIAGIPGCAGSGLREAPGAMPGSGNIMAVGDDAQSIYAFRGANVNNILNFPQTCPGAKLIRLEENYRSTQPVLDLGNSILDHAAQGFRKHLFTRRQGGDLPQLLRPLSDLSQGKEVGAKVSELLGRYPAREIAVLFRAGYQSYPVEVELNKLGIKFRKYGGLRYVEAAHIKDVISFARLVLNPLDLSAFQRVCDLVKGIGPKTALKFHQAMQRGEAKVLEKACAKHPELTRHLDFITRQRDLELSPGLLLEKIVEHYQPSLEALYPEDYPRRRLGLDELTHLAAPYQHLDLLISDLSLDDPLTKDDARDCVTLSTIHSAKGLEWGAVLILDLVTDRFPSRHAMLRDEEYEEERRLMYVACTRAKDYLGLFVPGSLYDRKAGGNVSAEPSPFVRELAPSLYTEWQESFGGNWVRRGAFGGGPGRAPAGTEPAPLPAPFPTEEKAACGYCTHKVFGRGKIVKFIAPDKYQVNFTGFGLKIIMGAYLNMEN
ncbi:MAG: ATP-dependent helicase [Deltaproteobacteria bacterium]|nr:ATP-dependent helicase [Deltaproteobacteria bacterium]